MGELTEFLQLARKKVVADLWIIREIPHTKSSKAIKLLAIAQRLRELDAIDHEIERIQENKT